MDSVDLNSEHHATKTTKRASATSAAASKNTKPLSLAMSSDEDVLLLLL